MMPMNFVSSTKSIFGFLKTILFCQLKAVNTYPRFLWTEVVQFGL